MTTSRKFAHFKRNVAAPRIKEIPEGGFCISAFVIISKRDDPNQILMGHLNKSFPWEHIGGLDSERVERHSKGWMLPSSGLIFGESPQEATQRILKLTDFDYASTMHQHIGRSGRDSGSYRSS